MFKYASCEDSGDKFKDFKKKIQKDHHVGDVYNGFSNTTDEILREDNSSKTITHLSKTCVN